MKKRRLSAYALAAILATVAAVFVLRPRSEGVTRADFERLRPGMTRIEAEHLLHGPPRDDLRCSALVWLPYADGKRRSGRIGPGTRGLGSLVSEYFRDRPPNEVPPKIASETSYFPGSTPGRGHQAVWLAETGLIAVLFGEDGRLQQTYFSDVHVSRAPTLLDRFSSRPGRVRKSLGR